MAILFLLNAIYLTIFIISWPEPERRQMVQQIVLQSSLLVMTAMMVQIHVGVAPDIAASIVIYVIGGAILLTSVTELVNLIRKSVNRCCLKKHVSDE